MDRDKSTLLRWEAEGKIPPGRRDSRGWRYYMPEDFELVVDLVERHLYPVRTLASSLTRRSGPPTPARLARLDSPPAPTRQRRGESSARRADSPRFAGEAGAPAKRVDRSLAPLEISKQTVGFIAVRGDRFLTGRSARSNGVHLTRMNPLSAESSPTHVGDSSAGESADLSGRKTPHSRANHWSWKIWSVFFTTVFILSSVLSSAYSAPGIPRIISYQGRLADSSGSLLGGSSGTTYYFRSQLWPSGTPCTHSLTVTSGVFNAGIGDPSSCADILDYNFSLNEDVYLEVKVSSNNSSFETLTPRQRIASSAFSLFAQAVVGTSTQSLIGTTTPAASSLLTIEATTTSAIPLTIRGFFGQAANLFQIKNATATDLITVDYSGSFGIGTSTPASLFAVNGLGIWGTNTGTSTNVGHERIKGNLVVEGAFEVIGGCKGCPSGGSGTPGGSDEQVQFNNSSSFGGATNLIYDNETDFIGIATTAPWGLLSVEHVTSSDPNLGALVVSDLGTSTPSLIVLNQNGFVGVATRTPGAVLSINGPFLAQSTSTINGAGLIAQALFSTTSLNFYTASNATPRLTIDSSGNVGIGTTSPSSLFSVGGAAFIGAGTSNTLT
ncbi:MAG: MerR family transcriptional regulator, partial [Candidatus Sungbacteria bacterium]|nr:MerR family transcriptional regulator [Candidatus Sungbacteria bacterium]